MPAASTNCPGGALARRFRIRPQGSLDSRKRGVRLLVRQLWEEFCVSILPSSHGYDFGTKPAHFKAACDFCRRHGVVNLALRSKHHRHPEATAASAQLLRFA